MTYYEDDPNYQVCQSGTFESKKFRVVYNHLIQSPDPQDSWSGQKALWNSSVMLKVKYFVWKVMHGKLPTFEFFLYMLLMLVLVCNVHFCGLIMETTWHIIWDCSKIVVC